MKRLISITLVLAMLLGVLSLGALSVSAETYSGTWGDLTWTLDDEGTLTISGEGEMEDFDYDSIKAWRSYRSTVKTVIITDGVTSVGSYAFYGCYSLTSVTIGDSVTSIGDYAFDSCASLTSITIPDSVTSIGDYAFSYCTSLTSITIPDSVTSIGHYAFYNTAYYNDESNWENGVLYIGNHLIEAKEDISGNYTIKNGTKCIANEAIELCYSLTSVTIPDSVTSIGGFAFYGCASLTSVTIGGSVTSIGDYAFYGCTSLTSVTIGGSVTSICSNAFYDCYALETVYYTGSEEQWNKIEIGSWNDPLLNANRIYNYVPEEPKGEKGDVNGDGLIDNLDALFIRKYDAGIIDLSDDELALADVNGDGCADNYDALQILKYDAGIIDEL